MKNLWLGIVAGFLFGLSLARADDEAALEKRIEAKAVADSRSDAKKSAQSNKAKADSHSNSAKSFSHNQGKSRVPPKKPPLKKKPAPPPHHH